MNLFRKYKGEVPKGLIVDHWGKDEPDPIRKKLDNRLENLRAVTRGVNSHNRVVASNATSKYLGVCKYKDKWEAYLAFNGKRVFHEYFSIEVEAAKAFNIKALEYFGEHANLNVIEEGV